MDHCEPNVVVTIWIYYTILQLSSMMEEKTCNEQWHGTLPQQHFVTAFQNVVGHVYR